MRKPRSPKINDEHKFTIQVALIGVYRDSMEHLDFTSELASFYLERAGNAWEAYKAFSGYPLDRPLRQAAEVAHG